MTTQAAVSDRYDIANEGLYWPNLLTAVLGLVFFWKRGRPTGRQLRELSSESRPRRVWPTSLFAGILAGLTTFATGVLAVFDTEFLLPANQITHHGYGQIFYVIGVFLLGSYVVIIGFGVAQLTAKRFETKIAAPCSCPDFIRQNAP